MGTKRGNRGGPKRVCAAVLCAVLLSGCGIELGAGVQDLLRAPQLYGDYAAVQTALNNSLETAPQLKYPANGAFLSPFVFGDWNGDGVQDAAVLYVPGTGANVNVAFLYLDENNAWQVRAQVEGLSGTVESALAVSLNGKNEQLLVGYTAGGGGQYLQLYGCTATLETEVLAQLGYSRYLQEDITGNGQKDLVVLTEGETQQLELYLLSDGEETITQQKVLGSKNALVAFSACLALQSEIGADGQRYLLLDGTLSSTGSISTMLLRYNEETGLFERARLPGTDNISEETSRRAACLLTQDIDGNGILEIPAPLGTAGSTTFSEESRYSFVGWLDYTSAEPLREYGIFNEENAFYLALPQQWLGRLLLSDGQERGSVVVSLLPQLPAEGEAAGEGGAAAQQQTDAPPEGAENPSAQEGAESPAQNAEEPQEPGTAVELFELRVVENSDPSTDFLDLARVGSRRVQVRLLSQTLTLNELKQWFQEL